MNSGQGRLGRLVRGILNLKHLSDLPAHDADGVFEILGLLKALMNYVRFRSISCQF
jgi:hypothetical protein